MNLHIFGQPKVRFIFNIFYRFFMYFEHWYFIAAPDVERLRQYCREHFLDDYAECSRAIRHKQFIIHPQNLMEYGGIRLMETVIYIR